MGAVTFSLDPHLVAALQSALPLRVLIETGTFKGDTVFAFESCFDKVVSIELSEILYTDAAKRFASYPNIQILQGNSAKKLLDLQPEIKDIGVIYWLDAHWCAATNIAGEFSECPLLDELQAIDKLNEKSVLLIDDARLFLQPPPPCHEISQWPNFYQIIEQLLKIGPSHEIMVVNDVIVFFPSQARSVMQDYAKNFGIDWLEAANCLRANKNFTRIIEEKEAVIQEKEAVIQEKEAVIQETVKQLREYQIVFGRSRIIRVIARLIRRSLAIFYPRLGNLNQYYPRPFNLNKYTLKPLPLSHTPKISIVTPSYQHGRYIEFTINSVLKQTYPNLEFFVQDGGSTDGTLELLKSKEADFTGWVSEKDNGQAQAINRGFAKTSGEIMAWLNSDDLILPGALNIVADFFNRHPDIDVVYGNRLLIDKDNMEIGRWILPGHDNTILSWVDYIPQETLFWRRRIWEKIGGKVDESFQFALDWDLLVRFRDAGAKFHHIPQFLGAFRIHEKQKTSAQINQIGYQEMNRIRERTLGKINYQKKISGVIFLYLLKHIVVDIVYRIKTRLKVNK